jgi:hypothetical protein
VSLNLDEPSLARRQQYCMKSISTAAYIFNKVSFKNVKLFTIFAILLMA